MAHHLISWLKVLSDQHGFVLINLSETFFFPGISTFDSKGSHILVCSPVYHPMHFFSSLILMASGALNGFHDVCFCSTHFLCFFFFFNFWARGWGRILVFSMIFTDFPCLILSLISQKVLYLIIV